MKNIYIIISLLLVIFASSCNDDRENGLGNEGQIVVKVDMTDIPATKAELPGLGTWNPAEVCKIEIIQNEDVRHSYIGLSSIPSALTLPVGAYTLKVTAGEEKDASFTGCFYEGETAFSVVAGESVPVELSCKLKNVLATIRFTDELVDLMGDDFQVYVIGDENAQLNWDADNNGDTGYYILPVNLNKLVWAVEGSLNGKNISVSKRAGEIASVKSNTNYILTFNYEDGLTVGDLTLTIEIVESDPEEDTIDYTPGTTIEGGNFDLNNPASIEEGSDQPIVVTIESPIAITNIVITVDDITKSAFGLNDSAFDFMQMDPAEIAQYTSKGIIFTSSPLVRSGNSEEIYSITISGEKIKELAIGDYSFDIAVTNKNGTIEQATLTLPVIGIAPVSTDNIVITDVWATKATIKGALLEQTDLPLSFDYRKRGESAWTTVAATQLGNQISANITGLQDNTTYQYCVKAGEQAGEIKEFTTEEARQLPNSSFEESQEITESRFNVLYFYPNGGEMFWDTGNKGSASAKKNVTTKSTDYVHEGTSSVQLKSQFAALDLLPFLGRFASGNIFTGKYEETLMSSLSDAGGKLSFGREFTSRPTKLRGWYKYTAGTITHDVDYLTPELIADGAEIGKTDKASIYFALSDKGEQYTIINTTAKNNTITLFDKNDQNIIAYGEFEETETTELKQFEIELDYRSLDRIPTHLIIVCSSSKYGDYFTGSINSTLWLDDFELIYE